MKNSLNALLKLTSFELDRLSKFLFTLIGLTFLSNLIGYIMTPMKYMSRINEYMATNSAPASQALEYYGPFSFYHVIDGIWILAPIAIGISGFLFYSVFIWYREWFGKNTFAYRLLMLPVSRMTLFFSKFIVIFIGIFTLIATQLVSLFIGYPIVTAIIERTYSSGQTLLEAIQMHPLFSYLLPIDLGFFLSVNGVGFILLLVLFTVILMERSFAVKGIFLGIVYAGAASMLVLFPLFIPDIFNNYYILYDSELLIIEAVLLIIVGAISIMVSRHLLNKKITI